MKKFKIYIASLLFVFASSIPANSIDMPTIDVDGLAMGITVNAGAYRASGSETEGTVSSSTVVETSSSEERVMGVGYPSIFVEYSIEAAMGLTLGIDYVPDTLSTESTSRRDYNVNPVSGTKNCAGTDCDSGRQDQTNTVDADFEDLITVYVMMPIPGTNAFIKAGMKTVDVLTKESLDTGSAYNDTDLDGTMIGFGWTAEVGQGVFIRAAADYTDFDDLSLTSTTNSDNSVEGTLEGVTASLSIGKSF